VPSYTMTQVEVGPSAKYYTVSDIGWHKCQLLHILIRWHQCNVLHFLRYRLGPVPSYTMTQVQVGPSAKYYTNSYGGTSANFYVELDTGWHQYQVLRRLRCMLAQVPTFTLTQIPVGSCAKLGGTGRHRCQVLRRHKCQCLRRPIYQLAPVSNSDPRQDIGLCL
jgi:hypothetical protein